MKTRKNYGQVNTEIISNGRIAKLETRNPQTDEAMNLMWFDVKDFSLDQPMNIQFGSWWVVNWDLYLKYFSLDTLKKCLAEIRVGDFLTLEWVPANIYHLRYSAEKNYIFSRVANKDNGIVKKGGTWVHDIVPGYNFYIPDKYDFGGEKLFQKCLIEEYKFLKHYSFESYHLNNFPEIYVHTGFKMMDNGKAIGTNSIYVPMDALFYGDSSIIVKRQTEYFNNYYNPSFGKWGISYEEVLELRDKHIGFLDSVIGKNLLQEVDEFRK